MKSRLGDSDFMNVSFDDEIPWPTDALVQVAPTGGCSCYKCRSACERFPGRFLPDEAIRALDAGMAGSLMLDWYGPDSDLGNDHDIFFLAPAAVGHEGRKAADVDELWPNGGGQFWNPTPPVPQPCSLLVDGKCSIHTSGFKPAQCRVLYACRGVEMDNTEIATAWDNDAAQAIVVRWKLAVGFDKKAVAKRRRKAA